MAILLATAAAICAAQSLRPATEATISTDRPNTGLLDPGPKRPQFRLGSVGLADLQQGERAPSLRRSRRRHRHRPRLSNSPLWQDAGIHPQDAARQQAVKGPPFRRPRRSHFTVATASCIRGWRVRPKMRTPRRRRAEVDRALRPALEQSAEPDRCDPAARRRGRRYRGQDWAGPPAAARPTTPGRRAAHRYLRCG